MSRFPNVLRKHMSSIHGIVMIERNNGTCAGSFECYICKQTLHKMSTLRSHLTRMHPMSKCTICNEEVAVADKTHSCIGQSQLACEYCTSSINSIGALISHLRNDHTASEKQSYACDICRQQFDMRILMEAHRKTGHFACTECHEIFDTKLDLKAHERVKHHKRSRL